jgi:hypothetical protein
MAEHGLQEPPFRLQLSPLRLPCLRGYIRPGEEKVKVGERRGGDFVICSDLVSYRSLLAKGKGHPERE